MISFRLKFCCSIFILSTLITGTLCAQELILQRGHNSSILALATSDNGHYIASGSYDTYIKIWDTRTNKLLRTINSIEQNVSNLIFSEDSKLLYSASSLSGEIRIWDVKSGKLKNTLLGHKGGIQSMDLSKDGKYLVSGSEDFSIILWDLDSMKPISRFNDHNSYVFMVKFSDDGNLLVSGGLDFTMKIWNLKEKKLLHSFKEDCSIRSAQFFQNNSLLLTGNSDGEFQIWDLKKFRLEKTVKVYGQAIEVVKILPDQSKFFTAGNDTIIKLWDIQTLKLIHEFKGHKSWVNTLELEKNGNWFISGSNIIKEWNIKELRFENDFLGNDYYIYSVKFHPQKPIFVSSSYNGLEFWDLNLGKLLVSLPIGNGYPQIKFSPDGQYLVQMGTDQLGVWRVDSFTLDWKLPAPISFSSDVPKVHDFVFGKDSRFLFTCASREDEFYYSIKIWDIENKKLERKIRCKEDIIEVSRLIFSPDNKHLICAANSISSDDLNIVILIYSLDDFSLINSFSIHNYDLNDMCVSPDGKYLFASNGEDLIKWDLREGKAVKKFDENKEGGLNLKLIKDGKYLISGGFSDSIKVWDTETGRLIKALHGHSDVISTIDISADGRFLLTAGWDQIMKIWSLDSLTNAATIVYLPENDYIFIDDEFHYTCSKNGTNAVAFRMNDELFPFEQFDLKLNRPDIILEQIGSSKELVKAYYAAYKKRLSKIDFREEMFSEGFFIPELQIDKEEIPIKIKSDTLRVEVTAKDDTLFLDRINVWINDVPAFGRRGIDLREEQTKFWKKSLHLPLVKGENKIQFSVLNQGGGESLKKTYYVECEAIKKKPDLYLINIGIETFRDSSFNLKYPLKDLRDFSQLLQKNHKPFREVIIKNLVAEEISSAQLKIIRQTLLQSHVDDHVILFVSGHGVMDENLDFYYATFNMDFNNPKNGGIPYDRLENLLDDIPARQKLFLLDVCHSGEIDKDNIELIKKKFLKPKNIRFRSFGNIPQQRKIGLENSFELMKEIFVDLRRGTGATVISSASGVEFAWEGGEWNNSVFTYCLLSGLKEEKADSNGDGKIFISELRDYLMIEVPKLTGNNQRPTMRVENISNDWRVW